MVRAKRALWLVLIIVSLLFVALFFFRSPSLLVVPPFTNITLESIDLSPYFFPSEEGWVEYQGHADESLNTEAFLPHTPRILSTINLSERVDPRAIRTIDDLLIVGSRKKIFVFNSTNGEHLFTVCSWKLNCAQKESPVFAHVWDPIWEGKSLFADTLTKTFFILEPVSSGMGDLSIKVFNASTGDIVTRKTLLQNAGMTERLLKAHVRDGMLVLLYRDIPNQQYLLQAYALPQVEKAWEHVFPASVFDSLAYRFWVAPEGVVFAPNATSLVVYDLASGTEKGWVDTRGAWSFARPSWKYANHTLISVEPSGMHTRLPLVFSLDTLTLHEGNALEGYSTAAWDKATITPSGRYHAAVVWNEVRVFDVPNEERFAFGRGDIGYSEGYKQTVGSGNEYILFTQRDPAAQGKHTGSFVLGVADPVRQEIQSLQTFPAVWSDRNAYGLGESWVSVAKNRIIVGAASDYSILYILGDPSPPRITLEPPRLEEGKVIVQGRVEDAESDVPRVILLLLRKEDGSQRVRVQTAPVREGRFSFSLSLPPGTYAYRVVAVNHANLIGMSEMQGLKLS